ncbi:MAG: SDR family oxidoreductase [Polyangiaceae bacterium]
MTPLTDAVVVLTGAAGGVGRATTQALLARGARVVAVDLDATGLDEMAGPRVEVLQADLAELAAIEDLATRLHAIHGRIDVLVNNAGLTVHGRFDAMTTEEIDRVIDVDLRAPIHLTRAVLPRLSAGGHVVFVSSMAGLEAFPTQTTYCAAKYGLRGFGAALRLELERSGIGASTVLPGTIATPFLANAHTHHAHTTRRLAYLMQRFGTPPERVANAIVRGIERNRGTLRVGWDCWAVSAAAWLAPPLVPFLLRQVQRLDLLEDA